MKTKINYRKMMNKVISKVVTDMKSGKLSYFNLTLKI